MHWKTILAVSLLLGGCAVPARDVELAGLDLNDRQVLRSLGQGLKERERGALATYALLHWPGSKSYCGQPAFNRAHQPATVGEAIAVTLAFDQRLAAKRSAERSADTPRERQVARERQLVDAFDQLTLDRDRLQASALEPGAKARRLQVIDEELEANRQSRRALASGSLL